MGTNCYHVFSMDWADMFSTMMEGHNHHGLFWMLDVSVSMNGHESDQQ